MKGGKGRRKGRHASTQAPVRNNLFLLCLDMGCLPRNPNKIPKIKNFIVFSCVALALTRSTFIPPSLRALPGADIPIICCLRQGQHTRVKTNNNLQIVLAQGRQAYNKLCVFIVGPRCRRRNRRKKESTKGPQKEPPGLNHFINPPHRLVQQPLVNKPNKLTLILTFISFPGVGGVAGPKNYQENPIIRELE